MEDLLDKLPSSAEAIDAIGSWVVAFFHGLVEGDPRRVIPLAILVVIGIGFWTGSIRIGGRK